MYWFVLEYLVLLAAAILAVEQDGAQESTASPEEDLSIPVLVFNTGTSNYVVSGERSWSGRNLPSGLDWNLQVPVGAATDGSLWFVDSQAGGEWGYDPEVVTEIRAIRDGGEGYASWTIPVDHTPRFATLMVRRLAYVLPSLVSRLRLRSGTSTGPIESLYFEVRELYTRQLVRAWEDLESGEVYPSGQQDCDIVPVRGGVVFHFPRMLNRAYWYLAWDGAAERLPSSVCLPGTCRLLTVERNGDSWELLGYDRRGLWHSVGNVVKFYPFASISKFVSRNAAKFVPNESVDSDDYFATVASVGLNPETQRVFLLYRFILRDPPENRPFMRDGPAAAVEAETLEGQVHASRYLGIPTSMASSNRFFSGLAKMLFFDGSPFVWSGSSICSWGKDGVAHQKNVVDAYPLLGSSEWRIIGQIGAEEYLCGDPDDANCTELVIIRVGGEV